MIGFKMKKINALVATSLITVSLTACQQMQSITDGTINTFTKGIQAYDAWAGKQTMTIWDETQNKSLRDKFLVLEKEGDNSSIKLNKALITDKYKLDKRTSNTIYLEKYITHQANFGEANRKIDSGFYVSEKDLAAKLFIEQALAQGHEVRMYKKDINESINMALKQTITEFNGASNRYDADPAFIEFDKSGSPVAIMTRSWQTISAIGVDSRIYTNIYFGTDVLRWFENNFSNRHLENALIRTIR